MKLKKAKVRSVKGIVDTGWFEIGGRLTMITGNSGSGSSLMKSLEAINPVQPITVLQPFSGHPESWRQLDYTKQIDPAKKTAAYMIFEADPDLVMMLDLIDPSLIEADRIEVGRRLDLTRWVSFVELSESSRWSDLSGKMQTLYEQYRKNDGPDASAYPGEQWLEPTIRLLGETADACGQWLHAFDSRLRQENGELICECWNILNLYKRFALGRRVFYEEMPPTVRLFPELTLKSSYPREDLCDWCKAPSHPVLSLLRLASERYGLHKGLNGDLNVFAEAAEKAAGQLVDFWPDARHYSPPRFTGDSVILRSSQSDDRLETIKHGAGLLSLLTLMLWGRTPILLFDHITKDAGPRQKELFCSRLRQAGRGAQVIACQPDVAIEPNCKEKTYTLTEDGRLRAA